MESKFGQLVMFLMALTALWVWGLVAFTGWRVRRRAAAGLPYGADVDTALQLGIAATGLLVLAIVVASVALT